MLRRALGLLLLLFLAAPGWSDERVRMVLVGPPGAGKGTQAELLSTKFGVPHLSTGDLLRGEIQAGSALGKQAKEYVEGGRLVPDDLIIAMVRERIRNQSGFILDGFPRSQAQARALDTMLQEAGRPLGLVLVLDVPDETLVERLSGRRFCPTCNHTYHLTANPPKEDGICDLDGTPLQQRSDDREDTIRKRLNVFHDQTEPIIQYYEGTLGVKRVDGRQSIAEVGRQSIEAVEHSLKAGSRP